MLRTRVVHPYFFKPRASDLQLILKLMINKWNFCSDGSPDHILYFIMIILFAEVEMKIFNCKFFYNFRKRFRL